MADDKNKNAAAEKAAKEAQKAQAAQEKAKRDAELKAQKEAAAREKAENEARLKAQKEAAKQSKKAAAAAKASAEADDLPEGSASGKAKLTRKQKKALLEKQKAREKELVEAGEIPMRRRYKPRGLFWRILGICLAFFMGIFATVGAIVGGGVFLFTKRSGDVIDFVLDFLNSGLSSGDILTQEYLDKKLVDVLHDAQTDILDPLLGDPANLTLKTLAKFTPVVDKYIDDLAAEYLKDLGISIDLEELKEQKFGDFASYAKTTILPQVELGPILELDTDVSLEKIDENSPMYALCYGKYGTDYEIADGTDDDGNPTKVIKMIGDKKPKNITDFVPSLKADNGISPTAATDDDATEGLMNVLGGIELGVFLGLDIQRPSEAENNNDMLYAICYGTEGVDFEFVSVEGSDAKILRSISDKVPTTVEKLMDDTNGYVNDLSLGSLLGLESAESLQKVIDGTSDNIMMYTLCYGTQNVDWKVENGKLVMIGDKKPVSIGELTKNSNQVMDDLPLGEILGLNTKAELDKREDNSLMYALCYGKEGEDYKVENDKIVMLNGKTATTLGELSNDSQNVINGLNVDDVLDVKPESDAVVRVVAYGNEMRKGDVEKGELVDQYGYLVDAEGNYPTEKVKKIVTDPATGTEREEETDQLQYVGGGRYIIETDNSDPAHPVSKIVMLPDPNDPDGKPYPKKTVGDLTAEDADLLDGVTLDSILDIDSNSSGIMQAMKTWTIEDLSDQDKIEGLLLGDVLEIKPKEGTTDEKPDDVSQIMWTLREKSIGELKEQETIDNLKLGEVLEIDDADPTTSRILIALENNTLDELGQQSTIDALQLQDVLNLSSQDSSSGIMWAMREWTLGDLNQQNRIERLKIGQIIGDATSGIMKAMSDWRISDLNKQEKIDSLTLGDVIAIDMEDPATPQMLKALQDKTLGEISKSIDTLTLEDVLGEDAFGDNKILAALRYKQIKELGDAIGELTVEDVFGDDIWSYAKNYVEGQRPSEKLTAEQVDTFYYHSTRDNVVTGGWYTGDDTHGYTKIGDSEEVVAERYVERRVYLTRTPSYYEVNYEDLNDKTHPYSGDVQEDDFGFYYVNEDGKHIDLEVEYTYTLRDSANEPAPEGVRIHEESLDGGELQFYYIDQVNVTYRFAHSTTTYAESDVTRGYSEKGTSAEVTAYHAGVWYLLLGDAETMPEITEMGGLVTGVASKINTLTLGGMYAHELIEADPSFDLSSLQGMGLASHDNLNDLNISEVIALVKTLANHASGH